jgi:hypothetical protein
MTETKDAPMTLLPSARSCSDKAVPEPHVVKSDTKSSLLNPVYLRNMGYNSVMRSGMPLINSQIKKGSGTENNRYAAKENDTQSYSVLDVLSGHHSNGQIS